jgi:hypothetical protein
MSAGPLPASAGGVAVAAKRTPGEPDRQISPDAEFFSAYGVGCLVLVAAFVLLTCAVWWFWMR